MGEISIARFAPGIRFYLGPRKGHENFSQLTGG
jgi:hypothetical protein